VYLLHSRFVENHPIWILENGPLISEMVLSHKSKIEILHSTRVNQTSHIINLRKELEMYKDMTKKQFNKEVADLSNKARARVSLYIAKAIHAFVKEGKTTIKISYFFK
jgi:hypothetical protein